MSSVATKRLQKELANFINQPIPYMRLADHPNNIMLWVVIVEGPPGSVYDKEIYRLQFKFADTYPMDSPEVMFIGTSPAHPHIYSNGHICLDILYDAWSPAQTVASVCLSIQSMLASSPGKERPYGDSEYCARTVGRSPKGTKWVFHDDTV